MKSDRPELKEAVIYIKYSLFVTIASMIFGLIGYLLKERSSFAIEVLTLGIVGGFYRNLNIIILVHKIQEITKTK